MKSFGYHQDNNREEGERPFWISYADLMTSLMILFLVVMVVALASIVKKTEEVLVESVKVEELVSTEKVRQKETTGVCEYLEMRSQKTLPAGVNIDCKLNRINFGEAGRYATDEYRFSPQGTQLLTKIVPLILETANTPMGQKWLKQVVIEGFTDTDGSYLYNLNLSLKRSEYLMCTLLSQSAEMGFYLTPEQRLQIKQLFLAGGVAFNDTKNTKEESRRVELKLQFYGVDERPQRAANYQIKFHDDPSDRCRI